MQESSKNRDRHKTRKFLTRPNKTNDINNKLHSSMYMKIITGKNNQHQNEKDTTKIYSADITLDVTIHIQ